MEAKYNIWLENNGNVVMSLWRANFLRSIDSCRSLKKAADKMNITYHEAQMKLDEMETGLGYKLATYTPGENGQDLVQLTPAGESLLKNFDEFAAGFDKEITNKFHEIFK